MTMHVDFPDEVLAAVRRMLADTAPGIRGAAQLQVAAALVQEVAYDADVVPSRTLMIQLLTIFIDLERAARDIAGRSAG